MISRRTLIGTIICAPAIVRASSLMPVKAFAVNEVRAVGVITGHYLTDASAWFIDLHKEKILWSKFRAPCARLWESAGA